MFYDEGWGVLLRTVHSLINTSPPELLREVVLVDDGSTDSEYIAVFLLLFGMLFLFELQMPYTNLWRSILLVGTVW